MCGIAGFYSANNLFSEAELRGMTSQLSHRGPDAEGFYFNAGIGLGHRRLSIIDLSTSANQPMVSHSGKSIICYNGEIYNFKEIKAELGIETRTTSDTEVILEAFEKWGTRFVEKLNGMFAIAIYNIADKKLYFFRDRMGIKPLFYYLNNSQLAFASEIKALTRINTIASTLQINTKTIGTFLHLGYIPAPETIYKHIFKFPQGSYGVFDGRNLELKTYWNLTEKITSNTFTDFNASKYCLNNLLQQSVKYRLISDVPYGMFLSGGIDSSLITAVAQKVSNRQIKTFSIGFESAKFNESNYAANVAQHLQTDHHAFTLTEKEALEQIPNIFDSYDEPYADSSAIPTMLVSKMARQHVTMTLSGDGGDELFHGYGMYQWAERLDYTAMQLLKYPAKLAFPLFGNKYKRIAHMFDCKDNERLKSHIFSQEQYYFSQHELNNLLNGQVLEIAIDEHPIVNRKLTAAESQALFDLRYYLPDDLLTKVDRATMRYSLETRVPLLDYNIVEFALNVHPSLKVNGNTTKYLLKELLYDYVPREHFNRPKWGFSIPLNHWLKTDLNYLIDDYLNENRLKAAGFVNHKQVSMIINEYLHTKNEYLYNRVWVLICLHKWYFDVFLNARY